MLVRDYLATWLKSVAVKSQLRAERYEEVCRNHLLPPLGGIRLDQLRTEDVDAWIGTEVEAGYKPSSIRLWYRVLQVALNRAVNRGLLARSPARLADVPPAPRSRREAYTPEQARALLAALHGERLEALYIVGICLGLAVGELLGLMWQDIDLETPVLHVRRQLQRIHGEDRLIDPKTRDRVAALALPQTAVLSLQRHRASQAEERLAAGSLWRQSGLVFCSPLGHPLAQQSVGRELRRILDGAGLPRITMHSLRHTCVSVLLGLGVDVRTVQSIARHASATMTLSVYAHSTSLLQRDAMARLDAAFGAKNESDSVADGRQSGRTDELAAVQKPVVSLAVEGA